MAKPGRNLVTGTGVKRIARRSQQIACGFTYAPCMIRFLPQCIVAQFGDRRRGVLIADNIGNHDVGPVRVNARPWVCVPGYKPD